jgi:YHS domain-containing protein
MLNVQRGAVGSLDVTAEDYAALAEALSAANSAAADAAEDDDTSADKQAAQFELEGAGGWVLHGWPTTAEAWKLLLALGVKPDAVVLLDVGDVEAWKVPTNAGGAVLPLAAGVEAYAAELDAIEAVLRQAGVRVSRVPVAPPTGAPEEESDPDAPVPACPVEVKSDLENCWHVALQQLDPFEPRVDEDLESDAFPAEAVLSSPFGSFCPVTWAEARSMVPGNPDLTATVRGVRYYFASEQAAAAFRIAPGSYLHKPAMPRCDVGPVAGMGRLCILWPEGTGASVAMLQLAHEFGLTVATPAADAKAAVEARKLAAKAARAQARAERIRGEDEEEEEEEEEADEDEDGDGDVPILDLVEALRSAYSAAASATHANKGVIFSDVRLSAELLDSMVAAGVVPSVIVPGAAPEEVVAARRMKAEFSWSPPEPEAGDDEDEEEPPAPPTEDELAEMEEAAGGGRRGSR